MHKENPEKTNGYKDVTPLSKVQTATMNLRMDEFIYRDAYQACVQPCEFKATNSKENK